MKIISLLLTALFLFSCGSAKMARSPGYSPARQYAEDRGPAKRRPAVGGNQQGNKDALYGLKLIYNASVYFKVDKAKRAEAAKKIRDMVDKDSGYVARYSSTSLVIRIKSEQFPAFIKRLEKMEGYDKKRIHMRDVTEAYRDLKIRLANQIKFKARYEELLKKAVTVAEMLKVEREIQRVTKKIELLKGKLEYLENQVRFSTIRVYIRAKVSPGIVGWVFYGIYAGIKWLFVWD